VSNAENAEVRQEIVIVRRSYGDGDDGHHGGVWKIAFADFMTAMMCFFLVMWLISASDEKTKAAVASYFNPVQLIDRNASRKGLEDMGDGPNAVGMNDDAAEPIAGDEATDWRATSGPQENQNSTEASDTENHSDDRLFTDPYAVLAEIAGDTGVKQNISEKGDGGAQTSGPATGASGGESYRDPFAPDFWVQQVSPDLEPGNAQATAPADETPSTPVRTAAVTGMPSLRPAEKAKAEDEKPAAETLKTAEEISKQISAALAADREVAENLSVVATPEGVTITITDQFNFGMYEIGSAVPRRELVVAMEKIGKILETQKGNIKISGHTDARPFRSETYDNWRLSTARAHSAYYMLTRSGMDEQRVVEVAGFADRKLKEPSEPLADVNRRIEILLETGE
jgi:chemotaxis protein MotB